MLHTRNRTNAATCSCRKAAAVASGLMISAAARLALTAAKLIALPNSTRPESAHTSR
ncbi:MAG: hypothetical protein ACI841_002324 [Planctomycetota bacterium]|jgi:hypothetical protein